MLNCLRYRVRLGTRFQFLRLSFQRSAIKTSLASLLLYIVLQSKLQDIYAQRFVSRFHYLVFNVHRRLFPIRICVSEASNKKPRYRLDMPSGQVKKTLSANTSSSSSPPLGYPCSAEVIALRLSDEGYYTSALQRLSTPLSKVFQLFFANTFQRRFVAGSMARRQELVYQKVLLFVKAFGK